jgi:hypothetical protein
MKYLFVLSLLFCLLQVPRLPAQDGKETKKPNAAEAPKAETKKDENPAGGKKEESPASPFKIVPAPDGRAYFPKGREHFYTKYLSAMKEPALQPKENETDGWTLRFTWLRSFHEPIAVRVWKEGDAIQMRAVRLDGEGGYDPGKIDKVITRKLTADEWKKLEPLTKSKELWKPLTNEEKALMAGTDGAQWIFERHTGNTYTLSDYHSPDDMKSMKAEDVKRVGFDPAKIRDFTNVTKLGMLLVKMAGLMPPAEKTY